MYVIILILKMGGDIEYNMLRPITDQLADYIGVERRKYFALSDHAVYKKDGKFIFAVSEKLYNMHTSKYFRVDPELLKRKVIYYNNYENPINPKKLSITLYEGKIKMIAPIPLQSLIITEDMAEKIKNEDDLYLECFDLSDVPDIYVYEDNVCPIDASEELSSISSNYDNYESGNYY